MTPRVNRSANSNTVSVTTPPGGGGGSCTASLVVQSQWAQGYVADVRVSGTGSSWTVTFTLPAGHSIVNYWNATLTVSGQTVTARNLAHNGTLPTTFGFQASRSSGTALPSGFTCA